VFIYLELSNSERKAVIDAEDFLLIKGKKWSICTCNGIQYITSYSYENNKKTSILLHRLIVGAVKGQIVDHKNHDTFDNRKTNLRFCSHGQNMANRKMSKANKLGVRGVTYDKTNKNYEAKVTKNGVRYRSKHKTLIKASEWVKMKSIEIHGEFCCLDGCL